MTAQKMTTNHLENVFGIESGTTISTVQSIEPEIITGEDPDVQNQEDAAIGRQLATIYGYAIDAFEQQTQMVQEVEPKFAARNAEVAAQYLNIALNSINTRATIRNNKLKLKADGSQSAEGSSAIMADRNELLRMMRD